jgi:ABC-2 type transport system permease protein
MTSATTAPAPLRRDADVPTGRLLARTCAAEWTRLWTVRGSWWFAAAAAAVMVGIGAVAGSEAGPDGATDAAWLASTVTAMPAQFALLALALTAVTSDHATGGIVPTLQWTPRRGVLAAARTLVAVGTATALGVLLALASAVTAWLTARPVLTLPLDEGLDALGTVAFVVATGTSLAVGIGLLLRNTAGALVAVFLLMLVLPLLLPAFGYSWTSAVAELLPGSGGAFLLIGEVAGMSTTSSVAVLLAWAAGALLLGWLRLLRDDANR